MDCITVETQPAASPTIIDACVGFGIAYPLLYGNAKAR